MGAIDESHPLFGVPGADGLVQPLSLSDKAAAEFADVVAAFGSFVTRCLCDKTWNLRAAAVQKVALVVREQQHSQLHRKTVPAVKKVLQSTIGDSVMQIFLQSLNLASAAADGGELLFRRFPLSCS